MTFAPHRLRDAFEAQGELGFFVWSYGSNDPLTEILRPNYFGRMCHRMRPGDLIYCGVNPQPELSPWQDNSGNEIRRYLLMVAANDRTGVRIRLVQDFGRPGDPNADELPVRRSRGRPRRVAAAA